MSVILDESVLHRALDNPAVVREQLDFLLVLQVRANVSIRIVPLSAPSPTLFGGGFCVYELADGTPYVLVEGTPWGMFACDPSDVRAFVEASASLNDLALDEQDSSALIKSAAERLADA